MIFAAIEFATERHRGQYRKTAPVPYILHPLEVARRLIEHGFDGTIVVSAVLHDTVEDTPTTIDEIAEHFGREVADLVSVVTEPDPSSSWEVRKRATLERLHGAPFGAVALACADKCENLHSIEAECLRFGNRVWSVLGRSRTQLHWYYRSLDQVFAARLKHGDGASLYRAFRAVLIEVFGAETELVSHGVAGALGTASEQFRG